MEKESFLKKFKNVPVSVNNLYGDPFCSGKFKENTFEKLSELSGCGDYPQHEGPVGVITKSRITKEDADRLLSFREAGLKLAVFVSLSGLPKETEPAPPGRKETIALCASRGIPVIAYIRPFIPEKNTGKKQILEIFRKAYNAGADAAVVSGLRGNDELLLKTGVKDLENWSSRVKIIPKNVREAINKAKALYPQMPVFERTSCGLAYVLGLERSHNPYWASPQLAGCGQCPLKSTCFDKRTNFAPNDSDIEFARFLGYDARRAFFGKDELCSTDPEKRTECVSCCTSCFLLERDSVEFSRFPDANLGDVGFLRLLTGKHVFCPGVIDDGNANIAVPGLLKDSGAYVLNSWWSYSKNANTCFGCSYCIVPSYGNLNREYGANPQKTAEYLWKKKKGEYL